MHFTSANTVTMFSLVRPGLRADREQQEESSLHLRWSVRRHMKMTTMTTMVLMVMMMGTMMRPTIHDDDR